MKRDRRSLVAFILRKRFRETISDPKRSEEVAIHLRLRTSDEQTRQLSAHAVRRATHRLLNSGPLRVLAAEVVPKSSWEKCVLLGPARRVISVK